MPRGRSKKKTLSECSVVVTFKDHYISADGKTLLECLQNLKSDSVKTTAKITARQGDKTVMLKKQFRPLFIKNVLAKDAYKDMLIKQLNLVLK